MIPDQRPLHVRVRALAQRYDAIASGAAKRAASSRQDADNARRDAVTLHDATNRLERTS